MRFFLYLYIFFLAPLLKSTLAQALPVTFAVPESVSRKVKVELFVTRTCESCKRLEKFLNEMEIPYIRYDLDQDPRARRDYYDHIGRGIIPVTRINAIIIRGDEPAKVYKTFLHERSSPIPPQPSTGDDIFGLPEQPNQSSPSKPNVAVEEEFALP